MKKLLIIEKLTGRKYKWVLSCMGFVLYVFMHVKITFDFILSPIDRFIVFSTGLTLILQLNCLEEDENELWRF
jgi:hypothetical protein